jgi:hypothetical protein
VHKKPGFRFIRFPQFLKYQTLPAKPGFPVRTSKGHGYYSRPKVMAKPVLRVRGKIRKKYLSADYADFKYNKFNKRTSFSEAPCRETWHILPSIRIRRNKFNHRDRREHREKRGLGKKRGNFYHQISQIGTGLKKTPR